MRDAEKIRALVDFRMAQATEAFKAYPGAHRCGLTPGRRQAGVLRHFLLHPGSARYAKPRNHVAQRSAEALQSRVRQDGSSPTGNGQAGTTRI